MPYSRQWCVGERSGELQQLIDAYKFQYARAAAAPLAELLAERIGCLPSNAVVVPVPTIAAHIRVRGYDHTLLLAQKLARQQNGSVAQLLVRVTTTQQRGHTRATRLSQAETAFVARKTVNPLTPYVLVDDVLTTGATLKYAALALRSAGARNVWAAVLAWQPLD